MKKFNGNKEKLRALLSVSQEIVNFARDFDPYEYADTVDNDDSEVFKTMETICNGGRELGDMIQRLDTVAEGIPEAQERAGRIKMTIATLTGAKGGAAC